MSAVYDEEINDNKRALRDHLESFPELEQEMYLTAREDVLKAERTAIADAAARGFISQEIYEELVKEVDWKLASLELINPDTESSSINPELTRQPGEGSPG
jgi:hypothetical protein